MLRRILPHDAEARGLFYGFLGVLGFSLTLPATRVAVQYLEPSIVGLGRALVAALLSLFLLVLTRQAIPSRKHLGSLIIVAGGVIAGFPLLSAWALQRVPSAHGAIILGLLPLATALVATFRGGERPSRGYWIAAILGTVVVIGFTIMTGAGRPQPADLALIAAVIAAAIGYAEGALLVRVLGGWQVICWALLLAAPFIAIPVGIAIATHGIAAPPSAWFCFAYVAIVSQCVAFFAWYRGLALGGVARVSQLQLLQPFITIAASALLLGEYISPLTFGAAIIVCISVMLGRKAAIARS